MLPTTHILKYAFSVLIFLGAPTTKAMKLKENIPPTTLFDEVRQKYSKYNLVSIDAKRETFMRVLNKTRSNDLKIFLSSKGDLRIETLSDPKNITILSDKKALVIDEPDPVFGGPLRVLVSKNPDIQESQSFLRLIFGSEPLGKLYRIVGGDDTTIHLRANKEGLSVQKASVVFDKTNKVINQIVYWDEQDNKITIDLEKSMFSKKEKKELFEFEIPKDAEVTEV